MTISSFIKLVELPTKVASVFPFIIGTFYAVYRYGQLNVVNLCLMFVAMLCLDMATTALNNYMDYKMAVKTHGFNYEEHNAVVKFGLSPKTVLTTIMNLVIVAIVLGLILFTRTDVIVLLLGVISFFFAAIYTWGPFPISRTPLGELVSGLVMGGIITFISIYIHISDLGYIVLRIVDGVLIFNVNILEIIGIFFVVLPLITGISNIMLANNTCDMEDDFENRRFTLPLVIGKKNALRLFAGLYILGYLGILIGCIIGWLPLTSLLTLITIIPVRKNITAFFAHQTKKETFIISVKNFVLISAVYSVTLAMGLLVDI